MAGGRQPFAVVPIPIGEYVDRRRHPSLPVEEEARAIGAIFERFGGSVRPWDVPIDRRDLNATRARLRQWAELDEPVGSVLVWLGHGGSNSDDAWLVVRGGGGDGADELIHPEELWRPIRDQRFRQDDPRRWAVVIVEACGAEGFMARVASALLDPFAHRGILLIGSGADQGRGYLATFRTVLANLLEERYSVNDAEIPLGDLALRIEERLDPGFVLPLRLSGAALPRPTGRLLEPVTASIEVYAELERVLSGLPPHEQVHFARKGMGADLGEIGWDFVGREQERAAILRWLLEADSGVLVLTGRPGSGKSAILGNLLLHAHPAISEILSRAGLVDGGWADAARLPPIDASVHLTGATVDGVTERLAAVAGVALPDAALSASQRTIALVDAIRESGRRLTVLADGLDEAQEPLLLAALWREVGSVPGVRVVVGSRASTGEGPDLPAPDGEELLDELGQRLEHVAVQWVRRDEDALAQYVVRRLRRADSLRRALGEEHEEAVRETAAMIAASDPATGDGREFLYASLAVHEILADPTLLARGRRGELVELLGKDHRALFDVAVRRLARRLPSSRPVLEALAFAQGRGLARAHRTWSTVASALARRAAGEGVEVPALTDDDLQAVLNLAGPYIMLDAEAGQSVYRLAHRTFQEHFLADEAQFGAVSERAAAIAAALLELASKPELDLNAYLVRHLSGHLAAAGPGAWLGLEERPAVLDRLDPHAVASDAMRTGGGLAQLPAGVIGTIASTHLIDAGTPADRPGLRALGAARATGYRPGPAGGHAPGAAEVTASAWQLRWARLRRHPPHLTLAGHVGAVRAVATFPGPDGSFLVASAGHDRAVRIWDPAMGATAGPAIIGHGGKVTAVAVVLGPNGAVRLATAGSGDGVGLWHPVTGRRVAELDPHLTAAPTAVASFAGPGGGARLAICTWNGTVWIWNPDNGRAAPRSLTGHVGPAEAATGFADAAGGPLLASVGRDGTVRIWDPETGREVRHWQGHDGPVRAVAAVRSTEPGDPSDLLATGGDDGSVVLWDPATGKPVRGPMQGHDGPVLDLAGLPAPAGAGSALLASGGEDRTIRLWDPARERAVGPVLTGHSGPVRSLAAFAAGDGAAILASGAEDGTVRIWYPEAADSSGLTTEQPGPVTAVAAVRDAAGTTVVAATAKDGAVTLWDLATGAPRGPAAAGGEGTVELREAAGGQQLLPSIRADPGSVRSLAAFAGPGGRTLLASAGREVTVRLWDAETGRSFGALDGHLDWVNAVVAVDGPDGMTLIASASDDGTVRIWQPATAETLHVLPLGIRCLSLAAAGQDLVIGTDEGLLVVRVQRAGFTGPTGEDR